MLAPVSTSRLTPTAGHKPMLFFLEGPSTDQARHITDPLFLDIRITSGFKSSVGGIQHRIVCCCEGRGVEEHNKSQLGESLQQIAYVVTYIHAYRHTHTHTYTQTGMAVFLESLRRSEHRHALELVNFDQLSQQQTNDSNSDGDSDSGQGLLGRSRKRRR